MTRAWLVPLLFLHTLLLHGQEDPPGGPVIRFGPSLSMDHVDREVERSASAGSGAAELYRRDGYRSARVGYSAGMDLVLPVGARLALLAGLRYSDMGFRSRAHTVEPVPGTVEADTLLTSFTHGYHFQYLQLPLLARFHLGQRRLRPVISAGLTPAYLLGVYRVIYAEIPEGRNERERAEHLFPFNRLNLFATAGIGLVHHSTSRIHTRVELLAHRGLLPVTDGPDAGRVWGAGILFGVLYSLRGT
jgi:hypothetical protein